MSPSFAFLDPDFATWPGAVYAGASARVFSPKGYGDAFETDIHASGGEPDRAFTLGAAAPMGRPGKPEEVGAEAIAWLLDDEAAS